MTIAAPRTSGAQGTHQGQPVFMAGKPLAEATTAMILMHGRGASTENIMELGYELADPQLALLAPQASGSTWYPYSFLAPIDQNEPSLSSALQVLTDLLTQLDAAGIPGERIFLAGFSQGACLVSEFAVRNARRYAGLLLFSGGLIGPPGILHEYPGSLAGTPVFLSCSDVDPHIPVTRVNKTATVLQELGASVNLRIYDGMAHTINHDEIRHAQELIQQSLYSRRQ